MKKKIHKLSGLDKPSFILMGISCHESDYRLTWAINKQMGFSFKKTDNHIVNFPRSHEKMEFTMFSYSIPESYLKFNIISNRCQNGFLIEKLKNIDFVLQIFGELTDKEAGKIVSSIKAIDLVSAVFVLNSSDTEKYSHLVPSE